MKKTKCATNGHFPEGGLCGDKIVGDNPWCGAHGNRKCIHKRDSDWSLEKERAELKVFKTK